MHCYNFERPHQVLMAIGVCTTSDGTVYRPMLLGDGASGDWYRGFVCRVRRRSPIVSVDHFLGVGRAPRCLRGHGLSAAPPRAD
jgi:hypothetical protein